MSERKPLSGLEDVVITTPKATAEARAQFQANRIARQAQKRDAYVAAAKVVKARKKTFSAGPNSAYASSNGTQLAPSSHAYLNKKAIKESFGSKRLASEKTVVNKQGEASFFVMNTETKAVKKITFERSGAMVVDSGDQPRDEYGRWM